MPDLTNDNKAKQVALLSALLCAGLSLNNGVTFATCSVRFAFIYCLTLLVGRVVYQVWYWSTPEPSPLSAYSPGTASDEAPNLADVPIDQGGSSS
jgi:hypothetical protein